MLNGFIIVGMIGLMYSLVFDGFGMLAVFNIHPSSLHGLSTVCILVGLARILAVIYRGVSSCTTDSQDNLRQFVLDIRDVEQPAKVAGAGPDAPSFPRATP